MGPWREKAMGSRLVRFWQAWSSHTNQPCEGPITPSDGHTHLRDDSLLAPTPHTKPPERSGLRTQWSLPLSFFLGDKKKQKG